MSDVLVRASSATAIVYVKDIDKCTAFYRDVLGMSVDLAREGWARLRSRGGTLVLCLERKRNGVPAGGSVHIGLTVEDVQAQYNELVKDSVRFIEPPTSTPFGWVATLTDPEGNAVDLVEETHGTDADISANTIVNDVLALKPGAMEVLEEHGIRICGGCIVLLNASVHETAEYSGLSATETAALVKELNEKLAAAA